MPTQTAPSPDMPSFPPPQTFDILPQIYDLVTRLPSAIPPSTNSTIPQPSTSDPLDPKDLPQAAVPIKIKIQKAKAAVSALPDVDRTAEEQEDEILELESKIERLMALVGRLGKRAAVGKGKTERDGRRMESRVMEGVEQG